jgi:hypothetical protein
MELYKGRRCKIVKFLGRQYDAHPLAMAKVLAVVDRAIFIRLIHKATHFHILMLDGVYVYLDNRPHDLVPMTPESRHSYALTLGAAFLIFCWVM